jgi:hypothetical protein
MTKRFTYIEPLNNQVPINDYLFVPLVTLEVAVNPVNHLVAKVLVHGRLDIVSMKEIDNSNIMITSTSVASLEIAELMIAESRLTEIPSLSEILDTQIVTQVIASTLTTRIYSNMHSKKKHVEYYSLY